MNGLVVIWISLNFLMKKKLTYFLLLLRTKLGHMFKLQNEFQSDKKFFCFVLFNLSLTREWRMLPKKNIKPCFEISSGLDVRTVLSLSVEFLVSSVESIPFNIWFSPPSPHAWLLSWWGEENKTQLIVCGILIIAWTLTFNAD